MSRVPQHFAACCSHGPAAAVASIQVTCSLNNFHTLQVPCQQLSALQRLSLSSLTIKWQGTASSGQGSCSSTQLPLDLSKRRCLELINCRTPVYGVGLDVSALAAYQQLHLALLPYVDYWVGPGTDAATVRDIVTELQQLTHLQLGGPYANDAIVSSLPKLPHLQALLLHACSCTPAAFAALPTALSRLELHMSVRPVDITFGSSTTPGLSQLTALQWLEVSTESTTGARQFDLALLRSLQKLPRLVLGPKVRLLAATDGSAPTGLAVISTLTALQHLALRCGAADGPHPLSAADVAKSSDLPGCQWGSHTP